MVSVWYWIGQENRNDLKTPFMCSCPDTFKSLVENEIEITSRQLCGFLNAGGGIAECTAESRNVFFIHLTQFAPDGVPSKMRDWHSAVKQNSLFVFFSGGGIADAQRIREEANGVEGLQGKVFVHLPVFCESSETIEGLKRFVSCVNAKSDREPFAFSSDEFGWPGISDDCHLEYALEILHALLPSTFGGNVDSSATESLCEAMDRVFRVEFGNHLSNPKEEWEPTKQLICKFYSDKSQYSAAEFIKIRNNLLGNGQTGTGLVEKISRAFQSLGVYPA